MGTTITEATLTMADVTDLIDATPRDVTIEFNDCDILSVDGWFIPHDRAVTFRRCRFDSLAWRLNS